MQILRPFMLRRLKQDVASELPDKVQIFLLDSTSLSHFSTRWRCSAGCCALLESQGCQSGWRLPIGNGLASKEGMSKHQMRLAYSICWMERQGIWYAMLQVEHVIKCQLHPYQEALCSIVGRASLEGALRGVSMHNSIMELRKICNHPFISKLHVLAKPTSQSFPNRPANHARFCYLRWSTVRQQHPLPDLIYANVDASLCTWGQPCQGPMSQLHWACFTKTCG